MNEIFGKKRNVQPELLLSSDVIDNHLLLNENVSGESNIGQELSSTEMPLMDISSTPKNKRETSSSHSETPFKKPRFRTQKISTLENMRIDRIVL